MKKWLVAGVIFITCLLVVVPVWTGSIDGVKSKWALARVANLAERDSKAAEAELEKIASQMLSPKKDCDYWLIKLRIALSRDDRSEAVEIVRSALKELPDFPSVANVAFDHFEDKMDYHHALIVLEILYKRGGRLPLHPDQLNELAYLRSLAGRDLDIGLAEINEALKWLPHNPAYLDTRAWLLFQMGLSLEALEDANMSVELVTKQYNLSEGSYWVRAFRWLNGKSPPSAPDGLYSRREADQNLWSLGVIRYHRGKILESLGRTEQAKEDWQWLKDHRLPQDDRMR